MKKLTSGIKWEENFSTALETSKNTNKSLLLYFYADWCPTCTRMSQVTYSDSSVTEKIKNFIPVKINIDKNQMLANQYDGNAKIHGGPGIPTTIILNAEGSPVTKSHGYLDSQQLLNVLNHI